MMQAYDEEANITERHRLPSLHVSNGSIQYASQEIDDINEITHGVAIITNDKEKNKGDQEQTKRNVQYEQKKQVSTYDGHEKLSDDGKENLENMSRFYLFLAWIRQLRATFGTQFLLLVCAVYAVQGFNAFSDLAIKYFFKDNLGLQPAESQALTTTMLFPWGIKPLYGIISDSLPLFGYHRKSYLIIFSTLGSWAYVLISFPGIITTSFGAVATLLLFNLSTATIDVVIDARVVEMSRLDLKNGANDLQTVSWIANSVGGIVGSFISGPATEALGVRGVFFFSAVGPLVVLVFSIVMKEEKSTVSCRQFKSSAKVQVRKLQWAITTPIIWKGALWVFLSGAVSPGYSQVFFYFQTDVLKFTPEFLGTVSAFGYIFLLVGTMIYNAFFKDISFRRIFLMAQVLLAVVSLLDIILVTRWNLVLGIPDKTFVLGDAVIADVISRLKTMPILVLCAKLCPKGVEGTLFALLMSISNFSWSVSEFWGAFICTWLNIAKDSYENLWIAIALRSTLKLLPIAFLFLIPATDPQSFIDQINFDEPSDNNKTVDDEAAEKIMNRKRHESANSTSETDNDSIDSRHLTMEIRSEESTRSVHVSSVGNHRHDDTDDIDDNESDGVGTVRPNHFVGSVDTFSPELRSQGHVAYI